MKFRSPGGPIRLASISGKTAIVGKEWRELPAELHAQALGAGCACDTAPDGGASADDADERKAAIRNALVKMIERKQEGDFNQDETPNARVVGQVSGLSGLKKEEVMTEFEAMKAEAAGEGEGAGQGGEG